MSRYVSMPIYENRPESEVVFQREGLAFQIEDNWVQSGEQLVPEAMFAFEEVRRSLELLFTAPVVRPLEYGAFTLSVDLRTGQIMDYQFNYGRAFPNEIEKNTELFEPRVAANFGDLSARTLNPNIDATLREGYVNDPMKSVHVSGVPGSQGANAFIPTATETEAALERTIEKYFGQGVTPREVAEAVGLMAASLAPGVGEALDVAVLISKAPWYYKALAGASLLLSVVTLGTSPNFGAAVRTGGEAAQQSTGVFQRIRTGLRKKLTRRNRLHEARRRYQPERLPGFEAQSGNLTLSSARREAFRKIFGRPSEGLGQLVRDLPKGHQARRDLARMIREIRATGGAVSNKGLKGGTYAQFSGVTGGQTGLFRYQPSKLRIADLLEEQVHWKQIQSGQHLRTYGSQSTQDVLEILAKQRVLQHPDITPAIKAELLDDLSRIRSGRYGQ